MCTMNIYVCRKVCRTTYIDKSLFSYPIWCGTDLNTNFSSKINDKFVTGRGKFPTFRYLRSNHKTF
jgi:hypothetical protein